MKQILLTYILLAISMILQASPSNNIDGALQMLADFTPYLYNNYTIIKDKNSAGEELATFKGENTFGNNEQGVRHNADLSMICAFLCKYGKDKVTLPKSITWDKLEEMARSTLTYSYSTHKANKLYACKNNQYWGSTSNSDHTWESSLWAMSVAYSAFFQWDKLTQKDKDYIYNLLKAECNYELERNIPTGYKGDTKAEENGWECDVLAVTLGLFPNDELAGKWFQRLREFAVNSYSHSTDTHNTSVIDPEYDGKTYADLYKGENLYDDFTLQNHNYFHTSYQNVVVQELGEAALALKLFQKELYGKEIWKTNSLMHNVQNVMNKVLYNLALYDGELAMPNGNDWSLFLYDQVTSYTTAACFLQDPDALMLEDKALRQIAKRQKTTDDGSWLLRSDVGARRMGVESHRVMMTWLMHKVIPTDAIQPTPWKDFQAKYSQTKYYPCQDVITASSDHRFTCFSWSEGLKSYTGYFAPISDTENNIIVPFRANNTGNYIGWYEVDGKRTNAKDLYHKLTYTNDNSYVINGTLNTNDSTLLNNYLIFTTPCNLILYFDHVKALQNCKINKELGGLLAISSDPYTKENRKFNSCRKNSDVTMVNQLLTMNTSWLNVDDCVGILTNKKDNQMAYGDNNNNNSILTSKLYTRFSDKTRDVIAGEDVDTRLIAYYSNVSAKETETLYNKMKQITGLPKYWNGYEVDDTDGSKYLIIYNFSGENDKEVDFEKVQKKLKPKLTLVVTISESNFEIKINKLTN